MNTIFLNNAGIGIKYVNTLSIYIICTSMPFVVLENAIFLVALKVTVKTKETE